MYRAKLSFKPAQDTEQYRFKLMKLSRPQLRLLVYSLLGTMLAAFVTALIFLAGYADATIPIVACVLGIICCPIMLAFVLRAKRDRNTIEAEVVENMERYRAIISASNTGAWEYHADTQYQWCSPEYFQMLGYEEHSFLKNNKIKIEDIWMRLLHPDDRQEAIEEFANYLAKKSTDMYETTFRMKHANGEWRWIWSRGRTLLKADGSLSNITLGIHTDITDRTNMEIDLVSYNTKLIKYAHLTAHEVRGPLARLLGLIQVSKMTSDIDYPWFFEKVNHEAQDIDKILCLITEELNEIGETHKTIDGLPLSMHAQPKESSLP